MRLHAGRFAPLGFATGALIEMTAFRVHHATVTLGQGGKMLVTIPLPEALVGFPAAVNAINMTGVLKSNGLAEALVHGHSGVAQLQLIPHRLRRCSTHFNQLTAPQFGPFRFGKQVEVHCSVSPVFWMVRT